MKRGNLRLLMYGAIIVVLLNAWIAFRALGGLFSAERWVAHTVETLDQVDTIYVSMSTANSAARGFLLTGRPEFDKNYVDAVTDVRNAVDTLQKLTADNTFQQLRIATLRQRIAVKLGAIDVAMGIRRSHKADPSDSYVLAPALADSPDGGISPKYAILQIKGEEQRLLADRQNETKWMRHKVIFAFVAASVLDLVLLVMAFRLLERVAEGRQQLEERSEQIAGLNAELTTINEELEKRVEQRTLELAVSNQELEAFSYSVSHDLRAPLRTIDGFSLALKEDFSDCLNEEGQDYINRVRNGVQRMGTLIDALLQLSRVTRSEVQRERVDMSSAVRLVFDELKAAAPDADVELRVQPGVLAMADSRLVRIAFENLVGNAFKYSSRTEHALVEFGSDVRDGRTVYFIRDNGVGFDMQYVDRLFTAFQRLHGDREFKGSGIGLATVSRIIRRHHGAIWAEGEVGKGATFFFTLEADPRS